MNFPEGLPELRAFPGDWCADCPVVTTWTETIVQGVGKELRREPCATIMENLNRTGKGSGSEPGDVLCKASLQGQYLDEQAQSPEVLAAQGVLQQLRERYAKSKRRKGRFG